MKKLPIILILLISQFSSWAQQLYIEKHIPIAQEISREHRIPSSLILAIAIHESAAGQSKIAKHLHNHFGIKGKNEVQNIRSSYKSYPSSKESYAHFANIITHKPYFASLQNQPVEKWVHKIHHGYARSPTWGAQVINIIKKYHLKQYDQMPNAKANSTAEHLEEEPVTLNHELHIVQKGETLSGIAKKYQTAVTVLKRKNHLNSSKIKIGQHIKL